MAEKIPIVLGRSRDYHIERIKEFCDQAAEHLGVPATLRGDSVLLKPNLVEPTVDLIIRCGAGHLIPHVRQHPHLPHRLPSRCAIDTHRVLNQIRSLQRSHLALPYLQVNQVRPVALRQRRNTGRLGKIGLGVVGDCCRAPFLGQDLIPFVRRTTMVLGKQTVDIHAAGANGEGRAAPRRNGCSRERPRQIRVERARGSFANLPGIIVTSRYPVRARRIPRGADVLRRPWQKE